jgi:hypothetical protein
MPFMQKTLRRMYDFRHSQGTTTENLKENEEKQEETHCKSKSKNQKINRTLNKGKTKKYAIGTKKVDQRKKRGEKTSVT